MLVKIGKTSWQATENMGFLCLKNEQRPISWCDIRHRSRQRQAKQPAELDFLRTDTAQRSRCDAVHVILCVARRIECHALVRGAVFVEQDRAAHEPSRFIHWKFLLSRRGGRGRTRAVDDGNSQRFGLRAVLRRRAAFRPVLARGGRACARFRRAPGRLFCPFLSRHPPTSIIAR